MGAAGVGSEGGGSGFYENSGLPVGDGSVRREAAAQDFLLERVLAHLVLVDLDAESRLVARADDLALRLDRGAGLHARTTVSTARSMSSIPSRKPGWLKKP